MLDEVEYSSSRLGDVQIRPTEVLEVDNLTRRHMGLLGIMESENTLDDGV